MSDLLAVCRAYRELADTGEAAFLATLVGVEGSSYRRPGARVLFTREAVLAGALSGGCVERELLLRGAFLAESGPVLTSFDGRLDDENPSGSGCEGTLRVLVEPLTPDSDASLSLIARELGAERRVALATVLSASNETPRLATRIARTAGGFVGEHDDSELARILCRTTEAAFAHAHHRPAAFRHPDGTALVEVLEPAPRLFIFGAGLDAVPVARLAASLDWSVSVHAPAGRATLRERFFGVAELCEGSLAEQLARVRASARPLALVMAHDYARDRAALTALLASNVPYIGVLGPAARTARLLAEIETAFGPIPAGRRRALFAPAGLALGAETPNEIALSLISEAQAALAGAEPRPLCRTHGPIHPRHDPAPAPHGGLPAARASSEGGLPAASAATEGGVA